MQLTTKNGILIETRSAGMGYMIFANGNGIAYFEESNRISSENKAEDIAIEIFKLVSTAYDDGVQAVKSAVVDVLLPF